MIQRKKHFFVMKSAMTWLHLPGKRSPFSPLNKGTKKPSQKGHQPHCQVVFWFGIVYVKFSTLLPLRLVIFSIFEVLLKQIKWLHLCFPWIVNHQLLWKQSTADFPKTWYFFGQSSKNFPFHHHFRSENRPFKTVESKFAPQGGSLLVINGL